MAVTGYMELLGKGIDISRVSPDQAMGKEHKLTGKTSKWDQRTETASLTDPQQIETESIEMKLDLSSNMIASICI